MKVIVPIGGGEISLRSTIEIDKYIVSLLNKETKKVLFAKLLHTSTNEKGDDKK